MAISTRVCRLARQWKATACICRMAVRAAGKDDGIQLQPAKELTLEDAVEYVTGGERVEVTPDAIRMFVPRK